MEVLEGKDGLIYLANIVYSDQLYCVDDYLDQQILKENMQILFDEGHYQCGMIQYNGNWYCKSDNQRTLNTSKK